MFTTFTELFTRPEYKFLHTDERLSNIALLGFGGSYAYGTNTETSDIDIRGIALRSKREILTGHDFEQVESGATDTVVYSFDKFVRLASACNPNVIELLGLKQEHYAYLSEAGRLLLENRHLFLSKQAANSFGGYANAQLRRLDNKAARKISAVEREEHMRGTIEHMMTSFAEKYAVCPDDAIKVYTAPSPDKERELFVDVRLTKYPLRDYHGMLSEMKGVISSYNQSAGARNNEAASRGKLGKHMMHLVRLYMMCFDILEKGEINTYREKEHDFLMDIRNGKYLTNSDTVKPEFFHIVDELDARLQNAKHTTQLPDKPDMEAIEELVAKVNEAVVYGDEARLNDCLQTCEIDTDDAR